MAYNLLDLTTNVLDDLQDPSFSSTRVRRYLNHGQKKIFNSHLFKFCEKSVSGLLTIGDYTIEQQSDHQTTINGILIDPTNNGRFVILNRENYLVHREFFKQFPDPSTQTQGIPSFWTEFGDQIYFDRPVDKAYTFRQRYYRVPTDLAADADVPDTPVEFRELLELWADYRAEKYRGNHDVAATYLQEFEDELEDMTIRFSPVVQDGPVQSRSVRTRQNYGH